MIAIIDYGMGNLHSVYNALQAIGAQAEITSDPEQLKQADGIILPGVGAFRDCMRNLEQSGLIDKRRRASHCWASAWACRCCLKKDMKWKNAPG